MQLLPNHLRPRREKIFGEAPQQRLDKNAKARILLAARAFNVRHKEPRQHWGPITRATFEVLRTLLYGFHHEDDGRCFPSYEAAAEAARCNRSTFYEAIKVLERAGLLSWINRIARVRVFEIDLFGKRVATWQVIRTSNAYGFIDPIECQEHRKLENPPGPVNQDFKKASAAQTPLPLDPTSPLGRALAGFGRALGATS